MANLVTASDTKVLFRCIQFSHHYLNFTVTPRAFRRQEERRFRFIKVDLDEDLRAGVKNNHSGSSDVDVNFIRTQYERSFHRALAVLASRPKLTPEAFQNAFDTAVRWATKALGKRLRRESVNYVHRMASDCILVGRNPPALPQYAVATLPRRQTPGPTPIRPLMDLVIPPPRKPPTSYADAVKGRIAAPAPPRPTNPQPRRQPVEETSVRPVTRGDPTDEGWTKVLPKKAAKKAVQPTKQTPTNITAVRGAKSPLSNFFPHPIKQAGQTYPSAEHFYHAHKAKHFSNYKAANAIAATKSASEAKRVSDTYFKSSDHHRALKANHYHRLDQLWQTKKRRQVVFQALSLKAAQCEPFRDALVASGTSHIIHNVACPYWGTGSSKVEMPEGARGANTFGKLLMEIRRNLLLDSKRQRDLVPKPGPSGAVRPKSPVVTPKTATAEAPKPPGLVGRRRTFSDPPPSQKHERAISISPPSSHKTPSPVAKEINLSQQPHLDDLLQAILPLSPTGPGLESTAMEETRSPIPLSPHTPVDLTAESEDEDPIELSVGSMAGSMTMQVDSLPEIAPPETPLRPSLGALSNPNSPLPPSARSNRPQVDETVQGPGEANSSPSHNKTPVGPKLFFKPLSLQGRRSVPIEALSFPADTPNLKDRWTLPSITAPILVLGDSLVRRITEVPEQVADKIKLVSYPGCRFEYMVKILNKNPEITFKHVRHVILVLGVNNRGQNLEATARKQANPIHNKLQLRFPNAHIYYAEPGHRLSNPVEHYNLHSFTGHFASQKYIILPPVENFALVDSVHWSKDTANRSVANWLKRLRPSKN